MEIKRNNCMYQTCIAIYEHTQIHWIGKSFFFGFFSVWVSSYPKAKQVQLLFRQRDQSQLLCSYFFYFVCYFNMEITNRFGPWLSHGIELFTSHSSFFSSFHLLHSFFYCVCYFSPNNLSLLCNSNSFESWIYRHFI